MDYQQFIQERQAVERIFLRDIPAAVRWEVVRALYAAHYYPARIIPDPHRPTFSIVAEKVNG